MNDESTRTSEAIRMKTQDKKLVAANNDTGREYIRKQLGARRLEYIITAVICVVFAFCFAHLEYYYIKDPALQISNGKVLGTHSEIDRSREVKPIIGNMYQYHLFPMLFIFILISFAALFDDMTFKLFGKKKRRKAFSLAVPI
jgi:hypothetical protein